MSFVFCLSRLSPVQASICQKQFSIIFQLLSHIFRQPWPTGCQHAYGTCPTLWWHWDPVYLQMYIWIGDRAYEGTDCKWSTAFYVSWAIRQPRQLYLLPLLLLCKTKLAHQELFCRARNQNYKLHYKMAQGLFFIRQTFCQKWSSHVGK